MKIISIKQPWAWLVVNGIKDVENRTWSHQYRGQILIHASGKADRNPVAFDNDIRCPDGLDLGGVVGIAEIVDCVIDYPSRWYAGRYVDKRTGERKPYYAFVLRNARPLPFVRWPGQLGIRDAPARLIRQLTL